MDKNAELKQLANRIKQLRIDNGYETAEAFALAHQLPIAQYQLYEEGYDIEIVNLLELMALLNVTPRVFFGEGFG